ncbi:Facilitated trehalose transporter Tret1-2 homolog-like Protein [Tribolium castaneum]|uniref:Facilitated trehalose transporter Tret1-2 homolog-like Protein n=3 Tax=Tribolium castaneum TaxID=7070 RepID=D6W8M8_TRICA|nr:Facilitated trehalose transporter Tret1-2 homolog-like Protein [Tribolium castaneum]
MKLHLVDILPQFAASFVATLSSISDGMHYAWSAPVLPLLREETSPVTITKIDEIWFEGSYLISGLLGLPITVYLVDKIGRKKAILTASATSLVSWILIGSSRHVAQLYCGRILAGASGDMAYVAIPMYLSEISNEKYRGLLTSYDFNMVLVGTLLISAVAPFTPYYVPAVIGVILLALQLAISPLMPESPYFLLSKNRAEEAKTALEKLRANQANIDDEFNEIAEAVQKQNTQKGKYTDLFLVKSNRRAVTIITVLILCQFFSGFSAVVMNLHTILDEADSGDVINVEKYGIIFYSLMVLSATFCCLTVDKFGKKILLIVSSVLTGVCLLIISIYFNLQKFGVDVKSVSWIPAYALMGYAVAFKIGMGFLPQVIVSELFPNNVKAFGMTYGDFLFIVFSFVSLIFYQYLNYFYGHYVPLYTFTVVAFLGAVFTYYFVPETKGKTLDQIQTMLQEM